jgi:hypothetical protein
MSKRASSIAYRIPLHILLAFRFRAKRNNVRIVVL